MHTKPRTRTLSARSRHPRRLVRPMAGQCFEIQIRPDAGHWRVEIPEIEAVTETPTRAGVELAARERIAASTGIPLGYISVWTR